MISISPFSFWIESTFLKDRLTLDILLPSHCTRTTASSSCTPSPAKDLCHTQELLQSCVTDCSQNTDGETTAERCFSVSTCANSIEKAGLIALIGRISGTIQKVLEIVSFWTSLRIKFTSVFSLCSKKPLPDVWSQSYLCILQREIH